MAGLIAHEWLETSGGAERVVDQMVTEFPDADLQVLWNDAPDRFPGVQIHETWLARTPLRRHKALALPLMPLTWRAVRRSRDYDWVLTSTHLFAHHVSVGSTDQRKFSYVHTPARYIWEPDIDGRGNGLAARAASLVLRPIDRMRARESAGVAANSEFTRQRIARTWGIDSTVIYPPVNVEEIRGVADWREQLGDRELALLDSLPSQFLLGASRFVPYKRLDEVIRAGSATDIPVVIAGRGPDEARLRSVAEESSVPVMFVASPSDPLLIAMYQRAIAFIFPSIEDFGIMPIEAMAAGTPVIVADEGGAAESVRNTGGGAIVPSFTKSGWRAALDEIAKIDRVYVDRQLDEFSAASFRSNLRRWMQV